jgi:ankyrin repeat domain-containing protein 50
MFLSKESTNINHQNKQGMSALMMASLNGHKESVQKLLQSKNINATQQNIYGQTASNLASQKGHQDIVHILMQYIS